MLLGCTLAVLHVSEVVFAAAVVGVLLDEVVLVGKLEDDGEEAKEGENDIVVESFGEDFDFVDVCFEQVGLVVCSARYKLRERWNEGEGLLDETR
jgi:hypothetical protein